VKLVVAVAVMALLGVSVANADKLSDFQDAKKAAEDKKGCESIPYSGLRDNCRSQQENVHPYCDGDKGPVSCGSESITRQLKDAVERAKQDIETLKNKKRDLQDQRSRASDENEKSRLDKELEQVEKDIYDAGKRLDQAKTDLDARKKLVEDATYALGKCLDYRRAVMNVFASTQDNVRGENDEQIQPLARYLRDYYEESKRGHVLAIEAKENALKTCKDSAP
jgi:DNA repair exonuclease SbcCD ATPase subunit